MSYRRGDEASSLEQPPTEKVWWVVVHRATGKTRRVKARLAFEAVEGRCGWRMSECEAVRVRNA